MKNDVCVCLLWLWKHLCAPTDKSETNSNWMNVIFYKVHENRQHFRISNCFKKWNIFVWIENFDTYFEIAFKMSDNFICNATSFFVYILWKVSFFRFAQRWRRIDGSTHSFICYGQINTQLNVLYTFVCCCRFCVKLSSLFWFVDFDLRVQSRLFRPLWRVNLRIRNLFP